MNAPPTRLGVVGCGLIAQTMHLHHLSEMQADFLVTALCDASLDTARANALRYGVPETYDQWPTMLSQAPVDAVLILTSGNHADIAVAAAQSGKHVLVEKPMCFSVTEGLRMRDAADGAGTILMVAYPKRYDPAFIRFCEEIGSVKEPRMMRVTTLEGPIRPFVSHYVLTPPADVPAELVDTWRAATETSITLAIGEATPFLRRIFHGVLLDTLVHEINTVRGALGEPDRLDAVDLRDNSVSITLSYGGVPVVIHWLDLPDIARYSMEFAFYGPDRRVTLDFPSPFLRNAPTMLDIEGGTIGGSRSWHTEEITSYDSAFKRELLAFRDAIVTGEAPPTDATDGLRDLALCEAIIRCAQTGGPVHQPTSLD